MHQQRYNNVAGSENKLKVILIYYKLYNIVFGKENQFKVI